MSAHRKPQRTTEQMYEGRCNSKTFPLQETRKDEERKQQERRKMKNLYMTRVAFQHQRENVNGVQMRVDTVLVFTS